MISAKHEQNMLASALRSTAVVSRSSQLESREVEPISVNDRFNDHRGRLFPPADPSAGEKSLRGLREAGPKKALTKMGNVF